MTQFELPEVLSEEHRLLEQLLYRLEEMRLISSDEDPDLLALATTELKAAYADVALAERTRKHSMSEAVAIVGAPEDITLGELADLLPDGQREELIELRWQLIDVIERIRDISIEGRQMISLLARSAETAEAI